MFQGKRFVVTGSASGIGRALAEELLRRGAVVVAWDRDEPGLRSLEEQAARYGRECRTAVVDVTDGAAVRAARDSVSPIDGWFNVAGVAKTGRFSTMSPADFRRIMDVNFGAVVDATRAAIEVMEPRGAGTIVNVASVAGFLPAPFLAAYSASKHAVVGFTRAVAEELRLSDSPLRLVLVAPGFVETSMIAGASGFSFPNWLRWLPSRPDTVAREILDGLVRGKAEIYPSRNGRWMMRFARVFPEKSIRGSQLLLSRSFKDWMLNRYDVE
jgi:NAD(P)-dependent dehydrogenase (short-subunit alcohol dehydrogenase family)